MKNAKSEALSRKKEEEATNNTCKHCEGKHKTKDHAKMKEDKQDKVEREVEKEENEE